MRSSNNELVVQRGETFSIDRTIVNKDSSPFIVSKFLNNPHLLIIVKSNKYDTKGYTLTDYLSLDKLERFTFTQPIPLTDLKDAEGNTLYPNGFSDVTQLSLTYFDGVYSFITAYYKGDLVRFEVNDAVFSYEKDGVTEYKYWKPDAKENGSYGKWFDYSFRFVKTFDTTETSKWVEQTYFYSITLVAGDSKVDLLYKLCKENNLNVLYRNYDYLYNLLLDNGIRIPELKSDELFVNLNYSFPILTPKKLSVLSNLKEV